MTCCCCSITVAAASEIGVWELFGGGLGFISVFDDIECDVQVADSLVAA